jgi:4-diphosphocytidyl-2-C-methyl-D-erythritol kinase
MKPRRFRSFAKINLGLEVVGRLPTGYHQLRTLFATLSLHDIVEISEIPAGLRVVSDHPDVPDDETNLARRAAVVMRGLAGRKRTGVSINVRKRIPVGGGLGGGSSNAATVLRALDLMWGLGLGRDGLLDAAKALGADVPYFLNGGLALGLGRGDEVFPLDIRPRGTVLLVPGHAVTSTADVFRRFAIDGAASKAPSRIDALVRRIGRGAFSGGIRPFRTLRNDLEGAARAESPRLAALGQGVRRVARATGATLAGMSGSGSSFFLLFEEKARERKAAVALRALGIRSMHCSFVSREAYARRFEIRPPSQRRPQAREAPASLLR